MFPLHGLLMASFPNAVLNLIKWVNAVPILKSINQMILILKIKCKLSSFTKMASIPNISQLKIYVQVVMNFGLLSELATAASFNT